MPSKQYGSRTKWPGGYVLLLAAKPRRRCANRVPEKVPTTPTNTSWKAGVTVTVTRAPRPVMRSASS